MADDRILIGKIVSAVGIKGEVKVYSYSDDDERFDTLEGVFVGDRYYAIESSRLQKGMPILKLEGVADRNAAEALREKEVFITEDDLEELPEGVFYVRDLIGLEVYDEGGALLGHLTDVLQNTAQDLYEVKLENGKKLLIPSAGDFIQKIDPENGRITVRLIEGMLDLQS